MKISSSFCYEEVVFLFHSLFALSKIISFMVNMNILQMMQYFIIALTVSFTGQFLDVSLYFVS